MKHLDEIIVFVLCGLFGAFIGFVVFMMALGGWSFVLQGEASKPWNGLGALLTCLILGSGWAMLGYKWKHREFGSSLSSLFGDEAGAILFAKRLMVIVTSLAALYFIWRAVKGT